MSVRRIHVLLNRVTLNPVLQRRFESRAHSEKKWDLLSAVCVERHSIITAPKKEIEAQYYDLLKQIELENSMKCDHELRIEDDKILEQKLAKGINVNDDVDLETTSKQTAQEFEDISSEELKNFKFAPRIPDKNVPKNSLKDNLDKNIMLLVRQKIGNDLHWIPPQGIRADGETMRQTAERVLRDACGMNLKVQFYGNAPIGFYKYVYPKSVRSSGSYGAKVFYFLAKYKSGNVENDSEHLWLNRNELLQTLPEAVHKSIFQFLIPD